MACGRRRGARERRRRRRRSRGGVWKGDEDDCFDDRKQRRWCRAGGEYFKQATDAAGLGRSVVRRIESGGAGGGRAGESWLGGPKYVRVIWATGGVVWFGLEMLWKQRAGSARVFGQPAENRAGDGDGDWGLGIGSWGWTVELVCWAMASRRRIRAMGTVCGLDGAMDARRHGQQQARPPRLTLTVEPLSGQHAGQHTGQHTAPLPRQYPHIVSATVLAVLRAGTSTPYRRQARKSSDGPAVG